MNALVVSNSIAALVALVMFTVVPAHTAITQPVSVISSGGGVSTSPGYVLLSTVGQPIIGLATGAGGSNHAGFIPALGGNGALWPIIGFDPTSFTFTFYVGEPAPTGQGLNITNTGGSTLEWTVARTQAWLTLSPLAGTDPASVSVGINSSAPGLVPGTYHDTITITATGAENSGVTIPVTLTVGQDYTLTVTFAAPTVPAGGGTVAFSPAPAIGAATCTGNPCDRTYHSGTPVILTAFGDSNSLFTSWSVPCSVGTCSVTMNSSQTVTATFSYVKPARIAGSSPLREFDNLQAAYIAALSGQTILARQFTFTGPLTLDLGKNITIMGGYAPNFIDRPGSTLLRGGLTVKNGLLIVDRLTVQ